MADMRQTVDFWMWPWRVGLDLMGEPAAPAIDWTTPNEIVADLPTMRLRCFNSSQAGGRPVLITAPYAVHDAGIADLAAGHSLIAALDSFGLGPITLTEWKSATPSMAGLSIDSYLADLNVAVDIITDAAAGPPDLVGLCQGGWMSLLYAAALPCKMRRLVLAGGPVDTSHPSSIADAARLMPPDMVESTIASGIVSGRSTLAAFRAIGDAETDACDILQISRPGPPALLARYAQWDERAVDLPGRYYADVLNWLFRENRLALNLFPAFGRPADLRSVDAPLYVLAGRRDTIAPPAQVRAALDLVGTSRENCAYAEADCSHLSLFTGARTLAHEWRDVANWLLRD
jgi:poly(3-hydroxyalkanoate) synthetase